MRFTQYIDEMRSRVAIFSFGSINPPTSGHIQTTLALVKNVMDRRDAYLFARPNATDNPLCEEDQLKFMRMMVPQMASNIIVEDRFQTVQDIAVWLDQKGYASIKMMARPSQIAEMKQSLIESNGVEGPHGYYKFASIQVLPSVGSDLNDELGESMLQAARVDDFDGFAAGLPSTYIKTQELYDAVKAGLK